jgi:hypothetical protein
MAARVRPARWTASGGMQGTQSTTLSSTMATAVISGVALDTPLALAHVGHANVSTVLPEGDFRRYSNRVAVPLTAP